MLKYYTTVSFLQIAKTSNQFFCLCSENENFETCIQAWFEQLQELRQFWGTITG